MKTIKEILNQVKKDNVEFIELQFTDFLGNVKSTTISIEQLPQSLEMGTWFDGSSIEGFARIAESDMYLKPDPDTYTLLSWRSNHETGNVARFISDIYTSDGKPFEGDPRFILKKVMKEANDLGYLYQTGPEIEFFLFKKDENGNILADSSGNGFYFILSLDEIYEVKREAMLALKTAGIQSEMSHYEVANNQHEIDFKYSNALTTANNSITLKYTIKAIAQKHGLYASFMPKPIFGVNGSGMHTHQSLYDLKRKRNAFYSERDPYKLSKIAYQFLAGQLCFIREISAVTAPTVNSYKRLTPGFEAPAYICWARRNRSALIRVPEIFQENRESCRLELRCPDPSSNPYLTFAVILKAGLEGIKRNLKVPKPVEEDIYEFDDRKLREFYIDKLPASLEEAVDLMEKGKIVREVFGDNTFTKYLEIKRAEWDNYRIHVTDWEKERYLNIL